MTSYTDLRSFINLNHMDRIRQGLDSFMKAKGYGGSNLVLSNVTLHTLAWKSFDYGMLTIIIGTSAIVNDGSDGCATVHYYNMTAYGHVKNCLMDLCVEGVEEVTEETLQKESILSLFGLPNITVDQLEDRAEALYEALCSDIVHDEDSKYTLPVVGIKNKLNLNLWPADLPDNCLGRLYLKPSNATIYDPTNMNQPYINELIPMGSILLNRRYYSNELIPDDLITAAHELVHWSLHQVYFLITHILDESREAINCTSDPIYLDTAMSPKEKAYFYAEWQANELAIRLAMPRHLMEDAITKYETNHLSLHDGYYYENMIHRLSSDFNIPFMIVRKRLRQLGYGFADGTFVLVDGKLYQPFTFADGSLSEDETYVIDEYHYKRLLSADTDFAALIASSHYIYTGYVVCKFSAKYVIPVINENTTCWKLSEYAQTHVSECCICFKLIHAKSSITGTTTHDNDFFCRTSSAEDRGESDKDEQYHLSQKAKEDIAAFMDEHYHILADMNEKRIITLYDALQYHRNRKGLTYSQIVERTSLKKNTVDSYFSKPDTSKHRNIPLDRMMILCNALQLETVVALDLLKRAQLTLNEYEPKGQYYHYLLSITDASLKEWNQILKEAGLEQLK